MAADLSLKKTPIVRAQNNQIGLPANHHSADDLNHDTVIRASGKWGRPDQLPGYV